MNQLGILLLQVPVLSVIIGRGSGCSPTAQLANFQTYRPSYFKVRDCGQRPLFRGHHYRSKRVAGGSDAKPGEWPWHVNVLIDKLHFCNGVLLDSDWVATAAHCLDYNTNTRSIPPASSFTVKAGAVHFGQRNDTTEEGSQTRNVSHIYMHPRHPSVVKLNDYDFALLKLAQPFDIGRLVQTACIHLDDHVFSPEDSECYAAGWGKFYRSGVHNRPETLQYSPVPLLTAENCTRYAASVSRRQLSMVTEQKMCAGVWSRDLIYGPCVGDSGAPLVCLEKSSQSWFVIGIVSHGPKCGEVGFYTKIHSMLGFIEEVLSGNITDDDFGCADENGTIPYEKQCDGEPDCFDMSDEVNCECFANQFRCDNGICCLKSELCDAVDNCKDGSDERDCEYFSCPISGRNISMEQMCDNENNCGDWADERLPHCECDDATHFKCPLGRCIPLAWLCDGRADCDLNCTDCDELPADEVNCTCREGYFSCNNSLCVHNESVCNGGDDCRDGSDEENCPVALLDLSDCPYMYCSKLTLCLEEYEIMAHCINVIEDLCDHGDLQDVLDCWDA